jgi:hypothetical protein
VTTGLLKPMRIGTAALAAAALAVAAPATELDMASVANSNAVIDWNRVAVATLVALPGPAGGAPPASQLNLAMTQGAVYDALNAIEPKHYRSYLLKRRFAASASKDAAVATAAYRVLTHIVSTVPDTIAFPTRTGVLDSLASQYAASLAAIPASTQKKQGVAAGQAAATAMIDARQGDGRFGPSPWVPNTAAGHWQPLVNPATGLPVLDPTPWVGGVRPFVVESSSQFRTSGPNALSSAAWAADFNEVKALGRVDSSLRTPEQTHVALFWQTNPVAIWNAVARTALSDPARDLRLVDAARLLAVQNLAAADAAINCWNDKYYWDFWRPWTAIQRADEDGNPATTPDPTWTPLITAPYPEQPSGHLCLDASHVRVMEMFFDTDEIGFDVANAQFPGETLHFDRFSDALDEITQARIWAGLHFRTADVQAKELGRHVAEYVAGNYFQPVA